jgi:hypothetical protein
MAKEKDESIVRNMPYRVPSPKAPGKKKPMPKPRPKKPGMGAKNKPGVGEKIRDKLKKKNKTISLPPNLASTLLAAYKVLKKHGKK